MHENKRSYNMKEERRDTPAHSGGHLLINNNMAGEVCMGML